MNPSCKLGDFLFVTGLFVALALTGTMYPSEFVFVILFAFVLVYVVLIVAVLEAIDKFLVPNVRRICF